MIDTFHPPKDKFRIKNPDDDGFTEYEWVPMRDDAPHKRKSELQVTAVRKKAKGKSTNTNATAGDSGQSAAGFAHPTQGQASSSLNEMGKQEAIPTKLSSPALQRTRNNDVFVAEKRSMPSRSANRTGSNRARPPEPASSSWKILERRRDLWGRRTVALTGMARRIGTEDPVEPVVVKFVWTPFYLIEHELRMLSRLAEAIRCNLEKEQGSSAEIHKLREALESIESEVAARRPAALGMLDDCNVESRPLPPRYGAEDGFEPDRSVTHVELHLSAMCTRNYPGERIDETTPLTMQQRGRILSGVVGSLWLAACSGIHYRDINTGNILFWVDADGVVYGFLIDYGNARELDERRMWIPYEKLHEPTTPGLVESRLSSKLDNDHNTTAGGSSMSSVAGAKSTIGEQEASGKSDEATVPTVMSDGIQLRLDDARSANVYFISTTVHTMLAEHEARKEDLATLQTLEGQLQKQPNDSAKRSQILILRRRIKQRDQTISNLPSHRYIDDLESALYAHIYQVWRKPFATDTGTRR